MKGSFYFYFLKVHFNTAHESSKTFCFEIYLFTYALLGFNLYTKNHSILSVQFGEFCEMYVVRCHPERLGDSKALKHLGS
jgi:hypothetical protein